MQTPTMLRLLGTVFAAYQLIRAYMWLGAPPERPVLFVTSTLVYVATLAVVLIVGIGSKTEHDPVPADAAAAPAAASARSSAGEPLHLPSWLSIFVIVSIATGPVLTHLSIDSEANASYGTWYIGGYGVVLVTLALRRQSVLTWLGVAVLAATSMVLLGPLDALGRGLVGSVLWVVVARLSARLIDRAARDALELAQLQAAASAVEAAQAGRERERRMQVQRALAIGGPVLSRVIAVHGALTEPERAAAAAAEARLRDELRGRRLLDDDVRLVIERARARGSSVEVFDEGGLDALAEPQLRRVRAELADAIAEADSRRIIIRTSDHERVAVTVVGRGADGDDVDLWREIERPAR